jgi:splicing factor 3A subunit 3
LPPNKLVWAKIRQDLQQQEVAQSMIEEYEDAEGNVFNKKTYEDLKRQGLLH